MNTRFKSNILIAVLVAMMMTFFATAGWSYTIQQIWARFSGTAGETLVTGNLVCIKDADGLVYKADANDAALRPAIGVIGKGGVTGVEVEIVTLGRFGGWTTLSEGAWTYLSETAGAATQSAPAYAQIIGFPINTTDYYFNFSSYNDTSALTALGVLSGASPLILEGATANEFETTIAVTDPTADRTITLPDASGVPILAAGVADAAHAITAGNSSFIFEGATADAFETTLTLVDPTADRTITLPNRTGQVQLASAASVLTPGAAVTLTVGLSNLYTLALNDNEDTTITFSGAGTAGDVLTIVIATGAGAVGDEVVTFHATLVSSTGTLTAANTASRFYVIRFITDGSHWYEVCRTAIQT